jgi:hypothetical protein
MDSALSSSRAAEVAKEKKSVEVAKEKKSVEVAKENGSNVVAETNGNDPKLPVLNDDPRDKAHSVKGKAQMQMGGGRNTESFDPKSTLVRPEMRVIVGKKKEVYDQDLKHDDVVIVPEFFCDEDDWSIYYKLIDEIREINENAAKKTEWVSWHEGAHLIAKNYESSESFKEIQAKIAKYFSITNKSVGTRFNWYKDSDDWKPFHQDSAAYNPQRAKNQNITVGVSLGSTRELSFLHAKTGHRIYFPQVSTHTTHTTYTTYTTYTIVCSLTVPLFRSH